MAARADLYVSADVEADGPIAGVYSMLSFGFAVANLFTWRGCPEQRSGRRRRVGLH